MKETSRCLLNAKNFALAAGLLWGVSLFFLTVIAYSTGYATELLNMISWVYPGYEVSAAGSVFGLIFGFIDAFIGCYIFAWLYNWLCSREK